jgi:imidazolonepropionase-like amidohydrolase
MRKLILLLLLSGCLSFAQTQKQGLLALKGAKIYTVTGGVIENGTILIEHGKILAVGPAIKIPESAQVEDLTGRTIIPGLVDSHSHLGIGPLPTVQANRDVNETTDPLQPWLRALDAIWPQDPSIRLAHAGGITTVNVMPGSGNVIGGQTSYLKLRGETVEEMLIPGTIGGMKMANGENPKRVYALKNQMPMTRMGIAALQRRIFIQAQEYRNRVDLYNKSIAEGREARRPAREAHLEPILEVLDRKRVVHHHSHRADDIMTVLRLAQEFNLRVVIHHGTEAYKIAGELARRGIPVSTILIDAPGGKQEIVDFSLSAPAIMERAGVKVAIHTDHHINDSRFMLREGALAIRGGMTEDGALRALTINPAEMLDLAHRIGSIAAGKDADLVVLSGPPFSIYTKVLSTYIEGIKVFDRTRPEDLRYATGGFNVRERYLN